VVGPAVDFQDFQGWPKGSKTSNTFLGNQLTNEFPRISKDFQGFPKELIFEFPPHHSITFSGKGRTWPKAILGLWPKKCLSGLVSQEISGFPRVVQGVKDPMDPPKTGFWNLGPTTRSLFQGKAEPGPRPSLDFG
jgi:hypothetical protein